MEIPTLQQLLEAGVHFGHQVRRGNPRMSQYIYGARDGVHIIDLTESEKGLKEACEFVYNLGKSGGVLLFVGTKKQAQEIVKDLAKNLNAPYLTSRWIGGFLTNFEEISKNIKKLKELKEAKEKGNLNKYTKKEQLLIDRRVAQLERDLGGVSDLDKLPDAIFVLDAVRDLTAIKEANQLSKTANRKVTVVAVVDSNADPSLVDFPIPGNDDAIKAIKLIAEAISRAYGEGLNQAGKDEDMANKKKEVVELEDVAVERLVEKVADEVAVAEEEVEKKEVLESERKV